MAGSVNKVILIGNLGRDPEVRSLGSGDRVASFSIATSENWRDRTTGERRERTEWHRISIFNDNLVKVAENYLRKGSKVYIEGSLQTRKYTDAAGRRKDRDGNRSAEVPRRTDHAGRPWRQRRWRPGLRRGRLLARPALDAVRPRERRSPPTWTTKSRSDRPRAVRRKQDLAVRRQQALSREAQENYP